MDNSIKTKSARARLALRREPYWARVRVGLYLGYRKLDVGEGTWIARQRAGDGKQRYSALGSFSEFDQAAKACATWADSLHEPVPEKVAKMTVSKACETYVEYQRIHKSEAASKDAAARFKQLVYGHPIGAHDLSSLKQVHIHTWITDQLDGKEGEALRRGKDSANRQLATFKSALNHVWRNGLVASDNAWRTVVPFKGVGRRRQGYVSMEQREALLSACDPDIRALVTAMLLTAARPGELAGVTAQNFDPVQGTLQLDGKTGHRSVALSTAARKFFEERAANKIGCALLLTTRRGRRWNKGLWTREFNAVAGAAGLPVGMVMYSLRHTAISDMIAGGLDAFVVAKIAGTSTTMIDKHYGHLRVDRTRALLDTINLLSAAA